MTKPDNPPVQPAPDSPPAETRPKGVPVIEGYLKTLPGSPGVYRMINDAGDVLYVGKAKDLKKRVTSYTRLQRQSNRIRRMVSETATMEFVETHTEAEALLLEANLIKQLAPRYNILLRDDKNFPSVLVTRDHPFPQVLKHRGAQKRKGDYFGPFASAGAVNQALAVLQRVFLLRNCSDSVFENRTRPCLLYQIKRCSGPCVGKISEDDYGDLVSQAHAFLTGDSKEIQKDLGQRMQQASDNLDFEAAADYRDRIRALTSLQAHQDINIQGISDADILAAAQVGGQTCVQVFFFRGGRNYGTRAYFPTQTRDEDAAVVLEAFIGQFYQNRPPPRLLLIGPKVPNQSLLAEALSVHAGHKVQVSSPNRGDKKKIIDHALTNATSALKRRMAESASQRKLLEGLAEVLGMDNVPERVEVYDNSHVSGTNQVGGMIVAGPEGLMKNAYRKFNIKGTGKRPADAEMAGGDDYAMMREVLTRRFSRVIKEDPDRTEGHWPDVVLVDGGKGQLSSAQEVFEELGVEGVTLAAIAKGPDRNAGRETFFMVGRDPFSLPMNDPVLYFLQRLRDEAHRFAIGTHRSKRGKGVQKSLLDEVPGIGAKRKKALLHHFGSAQAVARAGVKDLEAVEGINRATANKIYDWFHSSG